MKPIFAAADIGRLLSGTFNTMKHYKLPFETYEQDGCLHAKIPGFFCPKCNRFTPGENIDECVYEKEHRK